jgi:hypothetical protein
MIFDRKGVFPDEVVGELVHRCRHSMRASFKHRLAPTTQALICLNL